MDNDFRFVALVNNPVTPFPESGRKLPVNPFKEIAEEFSLAKGITSNATFIATCETAATQIATAFNITQAETGIEKLLAVITNPALQLKERLYSPCDNYKAVCSIKATGDDATGKYFASKYQSSRSKVWNPPSSQRFNKSCTNWMIQQLMLLVQETISL